MGEDRILILRKNYWKQKRDEIKKSEPFFYVCDECNGRGATLTGQGKYGKAYEPCKKCHCDGKLNWLENIFK